MLTISENAAKRIQSLLLGEGRDPNRWGLRVAVEGGGCSGFQYQMKFAELPEADGELNVFERDGSRVIIDPKSLLFVGGSQVDYIDGLTGAGFTIKNPNATGTCGCGQSFSV
ncbi:MAG TPA: iron-sulfur cluster assembly accessory protein [Planctomycetota bacterium]|jgi:iron-sulfur cluster assembly protein|nr:iron-sulfur cluster assembly accessory protein [Planctomycetota bacterium]